MKEAINTILGILCPTCDGLFVDNIRTYLYCGNSKAYFKAALAYSSPDGHTTASTLISMLKAWLLGQHKPTLTVNGTTLPLNPQCPTHYDQTTERVCINILNSPSSDILPPSTDPLTQIVGAFFSGLCGGAVLTAIVISLILWYVIRTVAYISIA